MTVPGASIVEWWMCCRGDSVAAKRVQIVAKIAYLTFGPKGENLSEVLKPLIFGFLRLIKRLGVDDISKVLMQALREDFHVPFFESPTPFLYECDLWGNGTSGV